MARSLFGLMVTVLATALAFTGRAPVRAAEDPQNEVLKKHGLRIAGSLLVLETESEVKNKLNELRRLSKQLGYSVMQQKGAMSPAEYQQTIQRLTAEIAQMRAQFNLANQQINLANQQMNSLPRYRGRLSTTMTQDQYNELLFYRNQLQVEVNEETAWLNQLKSQPPDPKSKEKIDAEVREKRDAYHQALVDLRTLVDSATEKYPELAKDGDVTKALGVIGKARGDKLKLGPSREFLTNVKLLEKLESTESSTDGDQPQAKPTRRSKKAAKSRQSSKAAGAAGNSNDPS